MSAGKSSDEVNNDTTTSGNFLQRLSLTRALLICAKLAIAVGIIVYLVHTQRLGIERIRTALLYPRELLGALVLLLLLPLVMGERWQLLLRSLEYNFRYYDLWSLTLIALFFDTVMPGGIADIVRGYYFDRKLRPQDRVRAASTVVVDRFLGLMALVLLAVAALAARARAVFGNSALRPIAALAAAIGIAFTLVFVFLCVEGDPGRKLLVAIADRMKPGQLLLRIYDAFRQYKRSVGTLILALGLSCVSHLLTMSCFALLGRALGESHLSFADYLYLIPLGLFAAQIPISPGGIGVGHIAFYSLFVMAGSRLGADLFSLFIVIRFISALPGLFYFLLISRQVRERQPAATQG